MKCRLDRGPLRAAVDTIEHLVAGQRKLTEISKLYVDIEQRRSPICATNTPPP
jgi:UDP-3-O-acyl-N-acetylglucosamine deacetylase